MAKLSIYWKKNKVTWFHEFWNPKKSFLHVVKICLLKSPFFNTKCSKFLPTFHRPFFVNWIPLFHPRGSAKGVKHWWTKEHNSSVQLNSTIVWANDILFSVLCVLVIERNYLNSYWVVIIIEYSFENRILAHLKSHEQFSMISINISRIQYKSIKHIN